MADIDSNVEQYNLGTLESQLTKLASKFKHWDIAREQPWPSSGLEYSDWFNLENTKVRPLVLR